MYIHNFFVNFYGLMGRVFENPAKCLTLHIFDLYLLAQLSSILAE